MSHVINWCLSIFFTGLRPEKALAARTFRQAVGAGLPPGLRQGAVQRQSGARLKLHADLGSVREAVLASQLR